MGRLMYDGTNYNGFQAQAKKSQARTIQTTVEAALHYRYEVGTTRGKDYILPSVLNGAGWVSHTRAVPY